MLSRGFLAIIKTTRGEMVYVDYCRGKIGNPLINIHEILIISELYKQF